MGSHNSTSQNTSSRYSILLSTGPGTRHNDTRHQAAPHATSPPLGLDPALQHCTALHCSTDSDGEHNSTSATLVLTLLYCCCWRWLHHLQPDFRGLVERSYLQACFSQIPIMCLSSGHQYIVCTVVCSTVYCSVYCTVVWAAGAGGDSRWESERQYSHCTGERNLDTGGGPEL